jgi:hypothetical protein
MMTTTACPGELIDEAVLRSSSPFALPPWTSSEKTKIRDSVVAPTQPNQTTGEEADGLIGGDAAPLHRRLPPILPPERSSDEEEDEDGPDLAQEIRPPTPILHRGRS